MTFAYLLLACRWTEEDGIEGDWDLRGIGSWSVGDIIEALIECEDQAQSTEDLWPWGWSGHMRRVSSVQVTEDWDPRRTLLGSLENLGAASVQTWHDRRVWFIEADQVDMLDPESLEPHWTYAGKAPRYSVDGNRAFRVLRDTLHLAKRSNMGLLFIGDEGWCYDDIEPWDSAIPIMEQDGFLITSRHG